MENDEIARYLEALEREDCYQADATLKESPLELTQRVFFVGANGARRGPYVRKFIHRDSGLGVAYERIFEAQQAGRRFKHIPTIFECYQHEDLLVVVMEFVNGETLQDRVYRHDPSTRLAADVFPLICDAVTELHESFDPPLIHRDLKPSNIMLLGSELTVIDFGIAREFKQGAEVDTTLFGTRAFAPPEQFGFGQTTVRSDVYALGMLLYYCLTEKIPTSSVRDGKFQQGNVPPQLRPVLVRATSLDPDERFASASELKSAFLEAMAEVDAVTEAEAARHDGKGHRAGAVVAGIVIAALAVFCALVVIGMLNQPHDGAHDEAESTAATQSTEAAESSEAPEAAESVDASGSTEASEAAESSDSAEAADSAEESQSSSESSSASASADADEPTESDVLDNMQISAPPRNSFDPATNITATVAGVQFQIPSSFGARITKGEKTVMYYYAETGSSLAMIMTAESVVSADSSKDTQQAKDDFLIGMISSSEELFNEIISSTDCSLAGHTARIVTMRGTLEGHETTTKAVFFINKWLYDDSYVIGGITFGQTDNVQFDYSADFAKTVASATAI